MDGEVVIGVGLDSKSFEKQIENVENELRQLEKTYEDTKNMKPFQGQEEDLKQLELQIEKTNNKLFQLKKQQTDINKTSFSQMGKGLKDITKHIVRWGLALFGIRTAYSAIRMAMSEVSRYNQDVSNTFSYAKTMIATALEPVIKKIVEWLKIALAYINALFKAWFKRDLFKETNANIEKANKNLKKTNKSAKELKKTLAGFDELNILNSISTGGGGGLTSQDLGVSSFDLDLPSVDKTGVFGWILDNKDVILSALLGIATYIGLVKLGLDPLEAALGVIVGYGIVTLVKNLVDFIKDPSWESFGGILEGLGITIAGITAYLQIIGVASGPIGWIITAISLLIAAIGYLIQKNEKLKNTVHDVEKAEEDLEQSRIDRQNAEKQYAQAIQQQNQAHKDLEKAVKELNKIEKNNKLTAEELYETVRNGTQDYKDLTPAQMKVYDAFLEEQIAITNVKNAKEKLNKTNEEDLYNAYKLQIANDETGESYEKLRDQIIKSVDEEKLSVEQAQDLISRMLSETSLEFQQTFQKDIPENIKQGVEAGKYNGVFQKIKEAIVKNFNKSPIPVAVKLTNKLGTGVLGKSAIIGQYIFGAKGLMMYPKTPRLAVGGLINQPGRGIQYRGATIAEKGTEAILPLTDSQQMSLLGAEIGKNVNIVATVPVYVGNRMVAREMKKINAENDFAFNR